jgi:hypothetical protein
VKGPKGEILGVDTLFAKFAENFPDHPRKTGIWVVDTLSKNYQFR